MLSIDQNIYFFMVSYQKSGKIQNSLRANARPANETYLQAFYKFILEVYVARFTLKFFLSQQVMIIKSIETFNSLVW